MKVVIYDDDCPDALWKEKPKKMITKGKMVALPRLPFYSEKRMIIEYIPQEATNVRILYDMEREE